MTQPLKLRVLENDTPVFEAELSARWSWAASGGEPDLDRWPICPADLAATGPEPLQREHPGDRSLLLLLLSWAARMLM